MQTIDIVSGNTRFLMNLLEEPGAHLDGPDARRRYTLDKIYRLPMDEPRTTVDGVADGMIVVIVEERNPDGPVYIQWTKPDAELELLDSVQEGNPNKLTFRAFWDDCYNGYRSLTNMWLREGKRLGNRGRWFDPSVLTDIKSQLDTFDAMEAALEAEEKAALSAREVVKAAPAPKSKTKPNKNAKAKVKATAKKKTTARRKK
ncbi:MAG: hypothetical protein AB7O71_10785 [Hyphomicrobiaceae bacterium]